MQPNNTGAIVKENRGDSYGIHSNQSSGESAMEDAIYL